MVQRSVEMNEPRVSAVPGKEFRRPLEAVERAVIAVLRVSTAESTSLPMVMKASLSRGCNGGREAALRELERVLWFSLSHSRVPLQIPLLKMSSKKNERVAVEE